jgi:MIP family channel proteins
VRPAWSGTPPDVTPITNQPSRVPLASRCLAEAFSTFALVFAGCGAIVVDSERSGSLGSVGIAVAFGLAIMTMIYAVGHVSGAHLNPAVTFAFVASRHFRHRDALAYVPAQLAGAVVGAVVLRLTWEGTPADLGATVPSVGTGAAFTYEFVLTTFLMFVVMAVATDTRAVGAAAAIAIGGTVALDALIGGAVTGASMNPARSFGPALVASEWTDFWIYVLAPVTGALAGGLLYAAIRGDR